MKIHTTWFWLKNIYAEKVIVRVSKLHKPYIVILQMMIQKVGLIQDLFFVSRLFRDSYNILLFF